MVHIDLLIRSIARRKFPGTTDIPSGVSFNATEDEVRNTHLPSKQYAACQSKKRLVQTV